MTKPSKRPQKSGFPVFSTLSHLVDHEQKLSPKELRPTGDRTLSRVRVYRPRLREMPAPARAEEGGEEGQDAAARGGTKRPVAPARRCCTSHARLRLGARRLQLTREQGITLRGSAGIVAEIFSKSSSRRPELGRAEPRPSRRPAAPPRWLGAGMARSGPVPSPRGPAPSARAEESAERRMPAPRSGRGANGGGEGLCAAAARLASLAGLEGGKGGEVCLEQLTTFGINGSLYQRGIYPSEPFTRVQKYGLTVLVATDLFYYYELIIIIIYYYELIKYLNNVVEQLKDWSYRCSVPKLVVVISDIESGEVLEKWQFAMECDKTVKDDSAPREKSQIRSVIRQITATVTFPPLLEVSCSFDLRIYTDKDLVVPEKWEESGPQFITNSEEVRLCSFTTTIHKIVHLQTTLTNGKEPKDRGLYPTPYLCCLKTKSGMNL
ncbi:LOW QUALITY PROTEIN: uncharacterized protein PS065_004032 [Dugong dugon]